MKTSGACIAVLLQKCHYYGNVMTIDEFSLYTQTALQVGQNFQNVLDGVSNTYENNLFVGTLFEFLEYEPKITSPQKPQPITNKLERKGLEIEFRNVSFTYPGKDPETEAALKNVSFQLHAGETIALVGRNGAGKTTIVKLLTRLYDPDEGDIYISGRNIKEYDLKELREEVGVIFQDYVTYHLNARETYSTGNSAILSRAAPYNLFTNFCGIPDDERIQYL